MGLEGDDLRAKTIPWFKFIFVAYFVTCGGAFGYEAAIGSAGPALTLLFTMIVPLIYSLPMALAVSELATVQFFKVQSFCLLLNSFLSGVANG
jgi:hypothetical protein